MRAPHALVNEPSGIADARGDAVAASRLLGGAGLLVIVALMLAVPLVILLRASSRRRRERRAAPRVAAPVDAWAESARRLREGA